MQKHTKLIDTKLIEECRAGDLNSFRQLVHLASPAAFTVAFRILGDEDQAGDVVQDVMVTVWKKVTTLRSPETFKTWMYRIVVNRCYDFLRKRKRNPEIRFDEAGWQRLSEKVGQQPSAELENREISDVIKMLTSGLSPARKTVFILSEIEELTPDEIAAVTGMKKSVIKSTLCHARKNISEMITRYL